MPSVQYLPQICSFSYWEKAISLSVKKKQYKILKILLGAVKKNGQINLADYTIFNNNWVLFYL
jgi:hypothetical protein